MRINLVLCVNFSFSQAQKYVLRSFRVASSQEKFEGRRNETEFFSIKCHFLAFLACKLQGFNWGGSFPSGCVRLPLQIDRIEILINRKCSFSLLFVIHLLMNGGNWSNKPGVDLFYCMYDESSQSELWKWSYDSYDWSMTA